MEHVEWKRIVCLANCWRGRGHRCVIGVEVDEKGRLGSWLRLVADPKHSGSLALQHSAQRCDDDEDTRMLDVVDVPTHKIKRPWVPEGSRQVVEDVPWERVGRSSWQEVQELVRNPEDDQPLWSNDSSSQKGANDRVLLESGRLPADAARLVHVQDLELQALPPGHDRWQGQVRARFSLAGHKYNLAMTDFSMRAARLPVPAPRYEYMGEALLCLSLADPYGALSYKMVVGVVQPQEQVVNGLKPVVAPRRKRRLRTVANPPMALADAPCPEPELAPEPEAEPIKLYTLGFSRASARDFFTCLTRAGVKKVVDVRLRCEGSASSFARARDLPYLLEQLCQIGYEHLTGFAPTQVMQTTFRKNLVRRDWDLYRAQFLELMAYRRVEAGLPRLSMDGACLLASDARPDHCHRRLVAEYLQERWAAVEVEHLLVAGPPR